VSKNKLIFFSALFFFVGLTTYALWKEITRDTAKLKLSITGAFFTAPGIGGSIIKNR
jgi:Membrane transport protein MerF.